MESGKLPDGKSRRLTLPPISVIVQWLLVGTHRQERDRDVSSLPENIVQAWRSLWFSHSRGDPRA